MEGKGLYIWADGRRYEGQWVRGERQGEGVMTMPNGEKYGKKYDHICCIYLYPYPYHISISHIYIPYLYPIPIAISIPIFHTHTHTRRRLLEQQEARQWVVEVPYRQGASR